MADEAAGTAAARHALAYLPAVDAARIRECMDFAALEVAREGCGKVFALQPELAFMEALAKAGFEGELFVCLANELDERAAERVERNRPEKVELRFVREGEFPSGFTPKHDALVAFGMANGPTAWLPAAEARLAEYYADFAGARVLVDCAAGSVSERPLGWASKKLSPLFTSVIY